MKKKIGKLVVAISIIALAVSGVSQADLGPITVPNFSFELAPDGSEITESVRNITPDSLGWNELNTYDPLTGAKTEVRPYIQNGGNQLYVPDGVSFLMLKREYGTDPLYDYNALSITWQILAGETINAGDEYLLAFSATNHNTTAVGNVLATLIYDNAGTLTEIYGEPFVPTTSAEANDEPWDVFSVSFTVPTGASCIGEDIGIKFEQTTRNWVQVDNVRLDLVPEPMTITLLGLGALGLLRRRKI